MSKARQEKAQSSKTQKGSAETVNLKHPTSLKRLNRIKGQVGGVERMLLEGRYCPEIIQQIKSVRAALKGLEIEILEGHLRGCVKRAFTTKDAFESEEKISELVNLLKTQ